jgi:hypothetical protein
VVVCRRVSDGIPFCLGGFRLLQIFGAQLSESVGVVSLFDSDPFAISMVSLVAAGVIGAIGQYVSAKVAKRRDREVENNASANRDLLDQQRDLIRELRLQLDEAWQDNTTLRRQLRRRNTDNNQDGNG